MTDRLTLIPLIVRLSKIRLEMRKLENNRKKLERGSFALSNLEEKLAELVSLLKTWVDWFAFIHFCIIV